jgi:hypothetical protein
MPALAPLKLTLYDLETFEVHGEYLCNFVPLRYLKLAIRLSKSLININEDTLTGLIVDLFGNQFSVDELVKYSEQNDRMAMLQAILTRSRIIISKPSENKSESLETKIDGGLEYDLKDDDWIIDLEISLINAFSWSLRELDETYIETLFPFISRFTGMNTKTVVNTLKCCDEVPGW